MKYIRLHRQFSFEAAHLLPAHAGYCQHLHGHSYRLEVEVKGRIAAEGSGPSSGMLLDLQLLKNVVNTVVLERCDHALLLPNSLPIGQLEAGAQLSGRLLYLPFTPTCENLVHWMASQLQSALPEGVALTRLCLWETNQSAAIWILEDQA